MTARMTDMIHSGGGSRAAASCYQGGHGAAGAADGQ